MCRSPGFISGYLPERMTSRVPATAGSFHLVGLLQPSVVGFPQPEKSRRGRFRATGRKRGLVGFPQPARREFRLKKAENDGFAPAIVCYTSMEKNPPPFWMRSVRPDTVYVMNDTGNSYFIPRTLSGERKICRKQNASAFFMILKGTITPCGHRKTAHDSSAQCHAAPSP